VVNQLYPFTGRYLGLDGLRYHYLDEGSGRPVVMLHGNPTWSFYYRNLVLALRQTHRVIVPDHIGMGWSDKPRDDRYRYTLKQRALDLEALLDHLHITDDITLVLHDWGGMIGMTYAHWHPERIRRLVVLNTAAFHGPAGKSLPLSLRMCRTPLSGALLVRGLNLFCRGAARYCSVRGLAPDVRAGLLAPYDSWANRIGVHRFVQDIPLEATHPSYALVKEVETGLQQFQEVPMLICWGARDFVFDDDFLRGWQERFPQAEVHRFGDAGHYVLEDKAEEIVLMVRAFLERT
jgi:haloalkane dehalogenase